MNDMQPYGPGPVGPPSRPTPPVAQWQRPGPLTDQRTPSGAVVVIAWLSAVLTFAYMLPWAIAVARGRSNMAAIGVLNLLLGWSLIGWIAALVMACQSHAPVYGMAPVNVLVAQQFPQGHPGVPVQSAALLPPAGWYPSPDGQGGRYWDGQAWTEHRAP